MADVPARKRPKVELLTVSANEAVKLRLLPPEAADVEDGATEFWPEMTHQLFGQDEDIKGHQDPSATIYISHASFGTAIEFQSAHQQPGATNVKQILEDNFPEGLLSDKKELLRPDAGLEVDGLGSPVLQSDSGEEPMAVHRFKLCEAPESVKTIHARAQQLLVFFVDGATPLHQSEPDWDLLLAVKNVKGLPVLVGFCTVYGLYAFPTNTRLRVSQILVLPPFQKQGVGKLLLRAVYDMADEEERQDVTYEEATEEVQGMRERLEVERAARLPWLVQLAAERKDASVAMNGSAASQPPKSLALSPAQVARAQKELRIPKQQVRRVWEMLLAQQATFKKEPGMLALRGLVARRLYGGFADTKQQAVGKQIVSTDDNGGFCMHRVPFAAGIKGLPVALEDSQEEGQSKEAREAALEEAVEKRMTSLLEFAERVAAA